MSCSHPSYSAKFSGAEIRERIEADAFTIQEFGQQVYIN
jgi:hypothetical protein